MSELKPIKRAGHYQACISFSGSVLDAETVEVKIGQGAHKSRQFWGGFSFNTVEDFNQNFMPVFEGTKGYCIEKTGVPVLYGYKPVGLKQPIEMSKNVVGSFLAGCVFSRFVSTVGALPSLRAMKSRAKGWKAFLIETDADIETTMLMNEHVRVNPNENIWLVIQRNCGSVYLESSLCSERNFSDDEVLIGFIFSEKPYKGQEKIQIDLTTEADVELARGFVLKALDNLASRV